MHACTRELDLLPLPLPPPLLSAAFFFLNSLLHYLLAEGGPPTHAVVVWDAPGATFRKEMYPLYKGRA